MNAPTIAVSSPRQPQHDHNQDYSFEPFIFEPTTPEPPRTENPFYEAFAARSAQVDRLIDEKMGYIMESARLRSLAKADPGQSHVCLPLIQDLKEKINQLQEQIDREMKGLFYSLQKAPAPSPFMDALPG